MDLDTSSQSSSSDPGGTSVDVVVRTAGTWRQRLKRLLVLLGGIYGSICILFMAMESYLIFPGAYSQPGAWTDSPPFTLDDPTEGKIATVRYVATDGRNLSGRLLMRANAQPVILFLHGNGIHAVDMDGWTDRLSDAMDATVLTAEYRGFQGDDFTPTDESTFEDALSAIKYLSKATQTPINQITIYGRSLGGGVAAGMVGKLTANSQSIRSLILDRTFDSIANVGQKRFAFLPVNLLLRNRFDSSTHLKDYEGIAGE